MWLDIIKAFIIGGIICMIGQFLIDYTKLTPARILTGYVVAGVILSAFGIYQYLIDFAGAGASVPLVGFGHLLADGVKKSISEDGFLGIFKGGLTASSAGITAAILFGLLASVCFKQRDRE
ncbi:MAG: stage V sporulation protein AE [Oscillospiraceae bacterium]|nr:stage V sporulation protein AE [Oscillospiraceae bacterium]